uniref:Vacuolar protein 8 n=1 Tax=Tetraselmis sp. GSL018 TaxID=582737 RepID=A0A061QLC1_9CHLO
MHEDGGGRGGGRGARRLAQRGDRLGRALGPVRFGRRRGARGAPRVAHLRRRAPHAAEGDGGLEPQGGHSVPGAESGASCVFARPERRGRSEKARSPRFFGAAVADRQHPPAPERNEKLYASAETVWGCVEKALNTLAAMCVVQDSAEKLLELLSTSSLRELLQCSDRYVRVAALRLARALTDSSDKGSKLLRAGVVPLAVEEVTRFNSEHASPNDSCVIEAVKLLRNLAYFEGGVQYVVKACGAEPLVELLITDSTFALKAEVCQALKNMAADPNAIDYLSHSGVISAAVGVVREASLARTTSTPNRRDCSDDAGTSIVFATGLLRNMVADPDQSELATLAVQSGALPVVVSLLEQTPRSEVDVETFVQAAAALNNITIHDPCCEALVEDCPNCLSIFSRHLLSSQSPPGNQGDWDEAMLQIASVIYNATQSHRTRGRVARSCSLQAVVALLGRRQGLVQTLSQSCLSIANIATEPRLKQLPVDQGAIPLLVDILRDSRLDSVAPEACTALHNLAANSPENKGAVVAAGAIPELIRVCRASRPSADAHRRAASLLNLLANRNREVRDAIVRAGGLDFLKFH